MEIRKDRATGILWLSQCGYMEKVLERFSMTNVKQWILRYLRGTTGYGITFNRQLSDSLMVGYLDADYKGDLNNRRSTTGYVFTFVGGPICWRSIVQSLIALSTTESEYMEVAKAAKEALWLTGLVRELGVHQSGVRLQFNS
ncbi:secreted RxLR effector protein 161-like [Malania oleifera]|uniref:secreted RxLR effector protein 161-like n=1 Tax=Malania oleifera TaxID=397392 RepID=UPI0025AE4A6A|nr:secreted RxLR effector protein 161-like [Malania oleifera]